MPTWINAFASLIYYRYGYIKSRLFSTVCTEYRGRVYGFLLTFFWNLIILSLIRIALVHFKKKKYVFWFFWVGVFFSGKPGIFFSGKPGIGSWEARDFFFWEARDWLLGSQGFCSWIIYKIGKISAHSITVGNNRKLSKVIRGILTSLKTSNLLNSSLTESFWNKNLIFEGRNWIIHKIGKISAHSNHCWDETKAVQGN